MSNKYKVLTDEDQKNLEDFVQMLCEETSEEEMDSYLRNVLTQKAQGNTENSQWDKGQVNNYTQLPMVEAAALWHLEEKQDPSAIPGPNAFACGLKAAGVPKIAHGFGADIFLEELQRYVWQKNMPEIYRIIMANSENVHE